MGFYGKRSVKGYLKILIDFWEFSRFCDLPNFSGNFVDCPTISIKFSKTKNSCFMDWGNYVMLKGGGGQQFVTNLFENLGICTMKLSTKLVPFCVLEKFLRFKLDKKFRKISVFSPFATILARNWPKKLIISLK
jgi:hypothetical protein